MAKQAMVPDRHGDYWWVDSRRLIEEDDFNRREDYGDIPKLAKEIKAAGLENLEPLTCYKKGEFWVVLKGHRRRRALKILEQEGEVLMVRILPAKKGFKKEDMILDQITGNEGKPLTPWEQAKVLRDLRGLGWSQEDIRERSGKSSVYVKRLLSLADAPQKLINLVRQNRVSATFAMDAIAEGKVEELIEAAEKNQLAVPPSTPELFPLETEGGKQHRTTQSDIQKPPSYKKIDKWTSGVDENKLSAPKLEVYKVIRHILDGTADEEYFKNYFQ
jgi:ParB-like chromosome segregation protein Spo0J